MLLISEMLSSGASSLGQNAQESYYCFVRSDNPDPSVDDADNPAKITQFGLSKFAVISPLGNVFADFSIERMGVEALWKCTAIYKSPTGARAGQDASFSFKIGGGIQKITTSKGTTGYNADSLPSSKIRDFGGAINVSGRAGSYAVAGVDIPVSSFDFKTTYYMHPHDMNAAYVDELKNSCACINSDMVNINVDGIKMKFLPGELLLLGAEGQKRVGFGDWEISLNWSNKPNETDLSFDTADGPITKVEKKGWQYLWVYYGAPSEQTSANAIVSMPEAVYVENVFDEVPMSLILPSALFGLTNVFAWTSPEVRDGGFTP